MRQWVPDPPEMAAPCGIVRHIATGMGSVRVPTFQERSLLRRGLVCAGLLLFTGMGFAAEPNLSGVVRYQADAARPWRYGRFYVSKDEAKTLGSTLVALRGRELKGLPVVAPRVVHVDQLDYRFIPEVVALRAGDTIRFTNGDATSHNVRDVEGVEPLNVTLTQDGESVYPFRRVTGIRKPIRIGCALHSQMQAWVYVFDHSYVAVTAEDGRFVFANVPPGEYDLDVVHPPGGLTYSRKVVIPPRDTVTLDLPLSPDHLAK